MNEHESSECLTEYSFFGSMEDADDALESSASSLGGNDSNSSLKLKGIEKDKLIIYRSHQIWDKTPDIFESWRSKQIKGETKEIAEISWPATDSNWLTVDNSECILYHELFWNDMGYCLSCYTKGLECDLVHAWCQCESNHMLPIQSPTDINRLRQVRRNLKIMKNRGSLKGWPKCNLDNIPSKHELKHDKLIDSLIPFKHYNYSVRPLQFTTHDLNSDQILSKGKEPQHQNCKINFYPEKRKNRSELSHGMDTVQMLTKLHHEKLKNLINEVSQLQKERNGKHDMDYTRDNNSANSMLSNKADATGAMTSPAVVKNKSYFQAKVNELKTGGTPARLEETKQIRAKIREEQLIRLNKQKEGKLSNKILTQLWRRGEVENSNRENDNKTHQNKDSNNVQAQNGKSKEKQSAKIPVMEKVSCPYKDKPDKRNPQTAHIGENTHGTSKKSPPRMLSSRLSNLKLMESNLQKENDEMSIRILSSPGVKRKAYSVPSKNPLTQSVPINYGSSINSCSYIPSKRLSNTNSASRFQELTAGKARHR